MATESILLDVDFEIVENPEEIRKMFGYSSKDEE